MRNEPSDAELATYMSNLFSSICAGCPNCYVEPTVQREAVAMADAAEPWEAVDPWEGVDLTPRWPLQVVADGDILTGFVL